MSARKHKKNTYGRRVLYYFGSKVYVAHRSYDGKDCSVHLKYINVKIEGALE